MAALDWKVINAKLPVKRDNESKERRKDLFRSFDPNGNGILSLAEVEKGIRDVLKIDAIFDAKPAIIRAFQITKNSTKSKRDVGDDYIEFREFRFFLLSLRQYFEYWEAFGRADTNSDRRISLVEFVDAKEKVETWVGTTDAEEEFKVIDNNGGGFILFDEFCDWAIKTNLNLEDDDDEAM